MSTPALDRAARSEVDVYDAAPCGCAAAVPSEPPRGALALRCEHGNRWRWLSVYRNVPAEAWCGPALDGCTVEMEARR